MKENNVNQLERVIIDYKDVIPTFEWLFDDERIIENKNQAVGFIDDEPTMLTWSNSCVNVSTFGSYSSEWYNVFRGRVDDFNNDSDIFFMLNGKDNTFTLTPYQKVEKEERSESGELYVYVLEVDIVIDGDNSESYVKIFKSYKDAKERFDYEVGESNDQYCNWGRHIDGNSEDSWTVSDNCFYIWDTNDIYAYNHINIGLVRKLVE